MRIVVTGATGLLGKALVDRLIAAGDSVAVLSRNGPSAERALPPEVDVFQWDPASGPPPTVCLEGAEAVVHLMGEPIQGRWTQAKKERIFHSRVTSTRNLVSALTNMGSPPLRVVSASAVGLYGDRSDELLTEYSERGQGFLPDVVEAWERSLDPLGPAGIGATPLRFGLVLSYQGGALKQLLAPWRLGLGVKIGDGTQWWPWVHIEDAVGLIDHALRGRIPEGAVNAVAPEAVTQAEFADQLARVLHRPRLFRAPEWSLRALLGEVSSELTASRRAVAGQSGYEYRFPTLSAALKDLLLAETPEPKGARSYRTEMWVDAPIDRVFDFFSDPANLEQITPPWLKFQVTKSQPLVPSAGMIIDYRLRLHRIPIRWQSEITEWDPPRRFVDVQRKGPYRFWEHTHQFEESEGGTLVSDHVKYVVPGGKIVDKLFVRRDLDRIFSYRQAKLRHLMGTKFTVA